MKVGNIVNGYEVVDVKRVNKLNLIQFSKAVSEYIDQGYKIDVNSARQIGLVLQIDMYKLDTVKTKDTVLQVNGVDVTGFNTDEKVVDKTETEQSNKLQHKTDSEQQDELNKSVEEAKKSLDTFSTQEPVKKTTSRTKKTT